MVNETGDPALEYLTDGITDSLIKLLSRLPQVRVIARSLVYRYKGKEEDALKIGRELAADTVLVSRVVALGSVLIIRAELVEDLDWLATLGRAVQNSSFPTFSSWRMKCRQIFPQSCMSN